MVVAFAPNGITASPISVEFSMTVVSADPESISRYPCSILLSDDTLSITVTKSANNGTFCAIYEVRFPAFVLTPPVLACIWVVCAPSISFWAVSAAATAAVV